jgi:hypothetical protein
MPGETLADLPTLDAIASRLTHSGDTLDATGNSAPGVPNAGQVAGLMGAVISHLTGCAGDMVIGMKGAGEQVTQARQTYAAQDNASANSFRGL